LIYIRDSAFWKGENMTETIRGRGGIAATVVVAIAIGIGACGGDDSTDATEGTDAATTASAETVEVTATEYEFAVSPGNPTTETQEITFVNDGEEPHAVVFARLNEGFTVDEAFKLEGKKGSAVQYGVTGAEPGKTGTLKIKKPIEPGDYILLCPIDGPDGPHYKLGQLEEFAIE